MMDSSPIVEPIRNRPKGFAYGEGRVLWVQVANSREMRIVWGSLESTCKEVNADAGSNIMAMAYDVEGVEESINRIHDGYDITVLFCQTSIGFVKSRIEGAVDGLPILSVMGTPD